MAAIQDTDVYSALDKLASEMAALRAGLPLQNRRAFDLRLLKAAGDITKEFHPDLFQRCLGIANTFAHRYRVDPDDAAVETYVVFLKQFSRDPDGFPTPEHIERFLSVVCRNIARNLSRAAQHRQVLSLDEARLEDDSYLAAHTSKDEIDEQWAEMYRKCTPEQCRILDGLRQGLSRAEVAASLGVGVNVIHKTIQRIRDRGSDQDRRSEQVSAPDAKRDVENPRLPAETTEPSSDSQERPTGSPERELIYHLILQLQRQSKGEVVLLFTNTEMRDVCIERLGACRLASTTRKMVQKVYEEYRLREAELLSTWEREIRSILQPKVGTKQIDIQDIDDLTQQCLMKYSKAWQDDREGFADEPYRRAIVTNVLYDAFRRVTRRSHALNRDTTDAPAVSVPNNHSHNATVLDNLTAKTEDPSDALAERDEQDFLVHRLQDCLIELFKSEKFDPNHPLADHFISRIVNRLIWEKSFLANLREKADKRISLEDEPPRDRPMSPEEQLQADLARRLKELIPTFSSSNSEEKAKAVLTLDRTLNQTFRAELRDEVVPLIKPLLQDIPGDYEGKRARAALVNGLLSIFNLAIQFQDDRGRTHVCSLYAVRNRMSDEKGYLRLRERTVSGSSQRTYEIPSLDKIQIIETPHQEPDTHRQPERSSRSS